MRRCGRRRDRSTSRSLLGACRRGFDEPVRERGATLSVGQKQLLSFARALAHDPRILVLDEATSSVDPETEHLLREGMKRLIENRTSLVIAHRLSTIQNASKIVVMHKGRVREVGTPSRIARSARDILQALSASVQGSGEFRRRGWWPGRSPCQNVLNRLTSDSAQAWGRGRISSDLCPKIGGWEVHDEGSGAA